jgi:NADH-quinone oxidoreductase subunit L
LIGALLTAIYTFRMVFITFFGEARRQVSQMPGILMRIPLIILAFLSIAGGFVELPRTLGNRPLFSEFMQNALPAVSHVHPETSTELAIQISAAETALIGIYLAYLFFLRRPRLAESLTRSYFGAALQRFWYAGWGFDWLYDKLFVRPFVWIARTNKNDFIDLIYDGIAWLSQTTYRALSRTVTGQVRWYAMGIAAGAAAIIAIAVFL